MLLRHLNYLTALARKQHCARSALACEVSQPALSAPIRQLEDELGVAIVERGNRFIGLTREGELVLAWARRTLADHDVLRLPQGTRDVAALGRGTKLRTSSSPDCAGALA